MHHHQQYLYARITSLYANRDNREWGFTAGQFDSESGNDGENDDDEDDDSPSLEELFGGRGRGVKYVLDTNEQQPPLDDETIDSSVILLAQSDKNKQPVIKEIAIMPFESPLFPGAREFLYIYEMRFRSLMNDVENAGNLLGRCFVSSSGAIGLVGSFCNIVERKKLKDGKGFYIVEAHSRFKIRRILKTEPYIRAEVEMIDDVDFMGDSDTCEKLCKDVYCELKAYLRIARLQDQEPEGEETIGLSPAIRDNRPLFARQGDAGIVSCAEVDGGAGRQRAFAHACANLLSTDPEIMQQLLQSQSTAYRLLGLKRILIEAVEELSSLMIDDGLLAEEEFDDIMDASLSADDDDSDLMPPEDFQGVTLATELDDDLVAELGIKEDAFVDMEFQWQNNRTTSRMQAKFEKRQVGRGDYGMGQSGGGLLVDRSSGSGSGMIRSTGDSSSTSDSGSDSGGDSGGSDSSSDSGSDSGTVQGAPTSTAGPSSDLESIWDSGEDAFQ